MKTLVAYFSCSGTTQKVAQKIAQTIDADLYEIKPAVPYTSADLNWNDKNSRSTLEMKDKTSRPVVADRVANMEQYDVVFVGFPIWWYVAPNIIQTFLESYDFSGKKIVPFATSGGSGTGKTDDYLKPSCSPKTRWYPTKLLNGHLSTNTIIQWINSLDL